MKMYPIPFRGATVLLNLMQETFRIVPESRN